MERARFAQSVVFPSPGPALVITYTGLWSSGLVRSRETKVCRNDSDNKDDRSLCRGSELADRPSMLSEFSLKKSRREASAAVRSASPEAPSSFFFDWSIGAEGMTPNSGTPRIVRVCPGDSNKTANLLLRSLSRHQTRA